MSNWIMKIDRKTRVALHLALLIFSVVTFAIYATVKSVYFIAATAILWLSAIAILALSPDRKEWFYPGNFFMRFSMWSRKHPIILALLVTAQAAVILTIGFLLIMRDTRKFIINMFFCMVLFLCLSVFGVILTRRVKRKESREDR